MGTYKDSFVELIKDYKDNGLLDYEFFDFSAKKYTENAQSRICHLRLKNESAFNENAIVMVFTIGSNVGRTVIQSEGAKTDNPSSTYPQKMKAINLAQENNWKYIALAISSKDFENEVIREYVVSIESTDYAKATVCVLDDCIKYLKDNGLPAFYRCTQKANGIEYSMAFIKKDGFLDYIRLYDNRPEVERYGKEKIDTKKYDVLDHNLYGIHIKEQNDALSDERPHICIGWSKLGDLSKVASKDELTAQYTTTWPESTPNSKGQNVGQIWRFINDIQIGDYVVYADDDLIHIGRVESGYYFDETEYDTQSADYKNTRSVVWLKKDIHRSEISESLHRSLATGMSIWTMNDYRAAIADLLMGTYIKDENDEKTAPNEQKEKFRTWMSTQRKANGEPYSTNTIASYISQMSRGYDKFDKYHGYESVFEIQSAEELNEYTNYLFNAPGFDEFNDAAGKKACSNGFVKYGQFLAEQNSVTVELRFETSYASIKPRNRIFFGAPGTGKSFTLNKERKALLGENNESDYERVTFHPDYSYANFVGTYKPVPTTDSEGNDSITYEYVPGPFMRVYVNALKNGRTNEVRAFLLIIEEINRANVAAVFGDIFQLLDRDDSNVSEYPIQASEDVKKYLAKELGGDPDVYDKIKLPDNMFIWATMNSADQGVFPMDTAFKRRWDFTYIGVDDKDSDISGKYVKLGTGAFERIVEWNSLRKAINAFLAKLNINEDKQLGPYFLSKKIVIPTEGEDIDATSFVDAFKNKVIMYLFEDAAKQKRPSLFAGCIKDKSRYSEICTDFEERGISIFNQEIVNQVKIRSVEEDNNQDEANSPEEKSEDNPN